LLKLVAVMINDRGRTQLVDERAEAAAIVASSHDAIVGMTRDGVITSCNPAAARLLGSTPHGIIGHRAEEFVAPEHRDAESASLRRIVAGEVVEPYRSERLGEGGSVVTVSESISPILDSAGVIVGAATAFRRISDLQQAHDRFEIRADERRLDLQDAAQLLEARAVQQQADVRDAAGRFEARVEVQRQDASDAAGRFEALVEVQRQDASDAAGRSEALVEIQRQDASYATDRFEAQVAQERVDVREAQERSDTEMEAERAAAERDKEHLQAQLQQSQRLEVLGQLAGGVAHDFNNLLAVILNYAAFVVEELATGHDADFAAAGRDVGQIQRAAERATALTHQLLAFARREIVRPVVLDLNDVVTEVLQLLDRTIGEDVVLRTNLVDHLWRVLVDGGQIEQVLVNLAINARDAMPDGGTLTIETANTTVGAESITEGSSMRAGRYVRLRVGDTGTGMAPDVIAHVFEPFYTTKAAGTGTGLGLATVYGIVVQAEGAIDIYSIPGVGTTFTILIPVTDEAVVPIEEEPTYYRTPTGETVLIVEDEQALREVTERIFTRSGYHVLTAAHGIDALAVAAGYDGDIHLLVTDVVMPNMLGKEVAEKILLIKPGIQVLYMSGYAQPVLASQGRLDRDVHLIEKPFSAATLIAMAGQILNGHFRGFRTVQTGETAQSDNLSDPR
jgi:two-component system cell cycle sensor histidine kinase/response regulator CckA